LNTQIEELKTVNQTTEDKLKEKDDKIELLESII
jgi:hypothetical protein